MIAFAALPVAGIATIILFFPRAAACSVAGFGPFEPLANGLLVQAEVPAGERAALIALHAAATARIAATFGAPRARPAVIFLEDSEAFALTALGATASTYFVPMRACVVIGSKGRNVDVMAHELIHAELFERVGFARRRTAIPVWFDEGVAMQVDFRSSYALDPREMNETAAVRELTTYDRFFAAGGEQLTWNYAAAKVEVEHWLAGADRDRLYRSLERIRTGATLAAVMNDRTDEAAAETGRGVSRAEK